MHTFRSGRELQRIGLSATVGNPQDLVEWLAGQCDGERSVYLPDPSAQSRANVELDFVGSLQNSAIVISRLHRGEKRLVFVDSRSRGEELSAQLRQMKVTTFGTHSSLSRDQRHQAEQAFMLFYQRPNDSPSPGLHSLEARSSSIRARPK